MSLRSRCECLAAHACSSPVLSRLTGRLSDLRLPRPLLARAIRAYARVYGVNLAEAALLPEGYATFDAFFTRRLAEGSRPIAGEPGTVVSPCDSLLSGIAPVPEDAQLEQIKGCRYSIAALLGSAEDAECFRGGVHATLYLTPAMYHRVHAPVDGRVRSWRHLPGRLFPVNAAGVRAIPGLFTRNERVCLFMDSEGHGPVAVVLVGAANVGRISLSFTDLVMNQGGRRARGTPPEPIAVRRGDELGAFHLGSTVVLLVADPTLVPAATTGGVVRMGQPLWRRGPADRYVL